MGECINCFYSEIRHDRIYCMKRKMDVEYREGGCNSFVCSEGANSCDDCEYYEFGAFSRFNTKGKCKITGKTRDANDLACPLFERG